MQYSDKELKLYKIVEKAFAPYLAIFLLLFISPFVIGTILTMIDMMMGTALASNMVKWVHLSGFPILLMSIINGTAISIILITKYFSNLFQKQKKDFEESINELESIEIIENKLMGIGGTIRKILFLRKILFWITSKDSFIEINNYFKAEIGIFISSIMNLRSDLATRLTEQRSTLESAKTEVEKNITGTPELLAVSEAQQVRLDRQIEQFEELQRVLVRV